MFNTFIFFPPPSVDLPVSLFGNLTNILRYPLYLYTFNALTKFSLDSRVFIFK